MPEITDRNTDRSREKKQQSWEWVHANQELDRLQTRTRRLKAAVLVLFAALLGTSTYGYLALKKHNVQLGELPTVQETIGLLGERVAGVEASLSTWSVNWDGLQEKLGQLENGVRSARAGARKHAQQLVAQLHERMSTELDERARVLETRMERIESDQEIERARLEQLQEQVAAVRRDTGQDLGALSAQITRSQGEVEKLNRTLERQQSRERVDFELGTGYTREIVPGVSLHLTGTNVSYQRVKGWVWLLPDRKTLWVRDVGIQQPLRFYRKSGGEAHELVFTRVSDKAAGGYLLLPAGALEEARRSAERDPFQASTSD